MLIKKEELYRMTNIAYAGLSAVPSYPSWALKDLSKLNHSATYTKEGFKSAINKIDRRFVNDLSDESWAATLGYLTVDQREIVSFKDSVVYSQELFQKFVEISGGANQAVIGVVSSSSQDDKDSFLFY